MKLPTFRVKAVASLTRSARRASAGSRRGLTTAENGRRREGQGRELDNVGPQKSRELLVCIRLIRWPALSSARLRNRTNSLNG
jgi:hypothetical protein